MSDRIFIFEKTIWCCEKNQKKKSTRECREKCVCTALSAAGFLKKHWVSLKKREEKVSKKDELENPLLNEIKSRADLHNPREILVQFKMLGHSPVYVENMLDSIRENSNKK